MDNLVHTIHDLANDDCGLVAGVLYDFTKMEITRHQPVAPYDRGTAPLLGSLDKITLSYPDLEDCSSLIPCIQPLDEPSFLYIDARNASEMLFTEELKRSPGLSIKRFVEAFPRMQITIDATALPNWPGSDILTEGGVDSTNITVIT